MRGMERARRERLLKLIAAAVFAGLFVISEILGDPLLVLGMWSGIVTLLWIIERKYRRRPVPLGNCPACAYDLTGNVSGTCPECGTPFEVYASAGPAGHFREIRPISLPPEER